jgi:diguanylate cyclase (GGDEF)-like protein
VPTAAIRISFPTGLLPTSAFDEVVTEAIRAARRTPCSRALLWLNLDEFKRICERYGIPPSEKVLKTTASRLLAAASPYDAVARVSGDEFAVLLGGDHDVVAARLETERLRAVLEQPQRVGPTTAIVGVSIGTIIFDGTADSATAVTQAAVAAMRADKVTRRARTAPAVPAETIPGTRLSRALLCLDGLSIGDALGETFFTPNAEEDVRRRHLREGPWPWTDDTAMAVSIVETLHECGAIDQRDLARRFTARYAADPARGYGAGAHQLLGDMHAGRPWRGAAASLFDGEGSHGNGAAMRAPVIGAWFAEDLGSVVEQAALSAEITHAHPEGIAGAIAVAVAAALACRPQVPGGFAFIAAVADQVPPGRVCGGVKRAQDLDPELPIEQVIAVLGNGSHTSAADTVPLVVWCAAHHLHDYEQALWRTVSALGDRDTTCAMVGGIVACHTGAHRLPAAWRTAREPLPTIAD